MQRIKKFQCIYLLFIAYLAFSGKVFSEEQQSSTISFTSSGELNIFNDITGSIVHFNEKWINTIQKHYTVSQTQKEGDVFKGLFKLKNGSSFNFEEKLQKMGVNEYSYKTIITSTTPVKTSVLCLSLSFPIDKFAGKSFTFGDKKYVFPEKFEGKVLMASGAVKNINIPLSTGTLAISGSPFSQMQDNRKYGGKTFTLRLMFTPGKGDITSSNINLKFSLKPFETSMLDLRKSSNMGFRDQTAGDGKGGWTDQGPNNDLSMITPGKVKFGGIGFDIINPDSNNGKSCIVLSNRENGNYNKNATVEVKGGKYRYLYFLHSAAWANTPGKYATVKVMYNDGSDSTFDIVGGRDISDWWGAHSVENGAVVWTSENQSNYIGLFLSRFAVKEKPIKEIVLQSTDNKSMWMVVGISGSNQDIKLPTETETYIVAGNEWRAFKHNLNVKKGSALDMSFLLDAPAGKHGRVIAGDGYFAFENEPAKPVRFFGANLCFGANYLSKKECEQMAARLASYGYNSIRLHHHDFAMVDRHIDNSLSMDKSQLDKIDYLFYCLKKHGIYVTTDIFVSRPVKASETGGIIKGYVDPKDVKTLAPVNDAVMNNLKSFAKNWLEHVNPYTKMTWKDDPALMTISFINENPLCYIWDKNPIITKIYKARFEKWKKEHNIKAENQQKDQAAFGKFLVELQIKSYNEMRNYVRDELGCKALYSDCNMQCYLSLELARAHFDFVDNHGYWDHPTFPVKPWSFPKAFINRSCIPRFCPVPANIMPTRVLGKPFTISEYNHVFPNSYRNESPALMGAYAAFQNWGGLYHFAYAHSEKNATSIQPATSFDVSTDPQSLLGERIVSLLFLREDVSKAKKSAPFLMSDGILDATKFNEIFSLDYNRLGLIHKTGTRVLKTSSSDATKSNFYVGREDFNKKVLSSIPYFKDGTGLLEKLSKAGIVDSNLYNAEEQRIRSDTGEIELNAREGTFKTITPKSECFVLPAKKGASGKFMQVSGNTAYATFFVSSIDNKPLATSKRLLLLHLTDIKNTKTKFKDSRQTVLEKEGSLPHLILKASANIKLNSNNKADATVKALDITGITVSNVKTENNNGILTFKVNTADKPQAVMAYEIIWN